MLPLWQRFDPAFSNNSASSPSPIAGPHCARKTRHIIHKTNPKPMEKTSSHQKPPPVKKKSSAFLIQQNPNQESEGNMRTFQILMDPRIVKNEIISRSKPSTAGNTPKHISSKISPASLTAISSGSQRFVSSIRDVSTSRGLVRSEISNQFPEAATQIINKPSLSKNVVHGDQNWKNIRHSNSQEDLYSPLVCTDIVTIPLTGRGTPQQLKQRQSSFQNSIHNLPFTSIGPIKSNQSCKILKNNSEKYMKQNCSSRQQSQLKKDEIPKLKQNEEKSTPIKGYGQVSEGSERLKCTHIVVLGGNKTPSYGKSSKNEISNRYSGESTSKTLHLSGSSSSSQKTASNLLFQKNSNSSLSPIETLSDEASGIEVSGFVSSKPNIAPPLHPKKGQIVKKAETPNFNFTVLGQSNSPTRPKKAFHSNHFSNGNIDDPYRQFKPPQKIETICETNTEREIDFKEINENSTLIEEGSNPSSPQNRSVLKSKFSEPPKFPKAQSLANLKNMNSNLSHSPPMYSSISPSISSNKMKILSQNPCNHRRKTDANMSSSIHKNESKNDSFHSDQNNSITLKRRGISTDKKISLFQDQFNSSINKSQILEKSVAERKRVWTGAHGKFKGQDFQDWYFSKS